MILIFFAIFFADAAFLLFASSSFAIAFRHALPSSAMLLPRAPLSDMPVTRCLRCRRFDYDAADILQRYAAPLAIWRAMPCYEDAGAYAIYWRYKTPVHIC